MPVHPDERRAFREAIDDFSGYEDVLRGSRCGDAFVRLMQTGHRLLLILDEDDRMQGQEALLKPNRPSPSTVYGVAVDKVAVAKARGFLGDPCSKCQAFTLIRTGTCVKCVSCYHDSGCG